MLNQTTTPEKRVVKLWTPPGVQRRSVHASRLFRELSEHECAEILSYAMRRRFMNGEPIFVQGEPVRSFILLQSGIVKHTQASSDGKKALLRVSGGGDVLNFRDRLALHTCSALAMEKCEALVWECRDIEWLFAKYPQLRRNVDRLVVLQLEELEERCREIATETTAQRLATQLVRLCHQIGRKSRRGLRVSLSREELAQMTGATLHTISRLLAQWDRQGLLLAYRQTVVVNDTGKLALVMDVETSEPGRMPYLT